MALFDDTSAPDPMDKYAALTATTGDSLGVAPTIIHGAVATVADVGTTLWNSLTPERYEVSTQDLLSRVDTDALQVYNENKDTINTLSFVAGMALPLGLSMKGMGLLRAGAKGTSWFSEAASASRLTAAENTFKLAGPTSEAYIKAQWVVYRGVAANNILDSAVAELAILGTMSAHPMMEDYKKDLGTNFLIGAAFGGAIGTGVGSIIAKKEMANLTGKIDLEGNKIILDSMHKAADEAKISPFSHLGEQVAVRAQNVENLKGVLQESKEGLQQLHPWTQKKLEIVIEDESARLFTDLRAASTGQMEEFLSKAKQGEAQFIMDFAARPEVAGLDKIGFATVSDAKAAKGKPGVLQSTVEFFKRTIDASGKEELKRTDAYWSNEFNRFFGKGDANHYLTVADLGQSIDELKKGIEKNFGVLARADTSIEREILPSAKVDADFAKAVLHVKDMEWEDLNKLTIAPDDLAMMKAVHTRAAALRDSSGGEDLLKITVAKPQQSREAIEQQVLVRGGLKPDYTKQLQVLDAEMDQFHLADLMHTKKKDSFLGKVDDNVEHNLIMWIGGSYDFLRNGALAVRGMTSTFEDMLDAAGMREIWRARDVLNSARFSDASKSLRDRFSTLADADGNVWLYRGLREDPSGHRALESYSTSPHKAAEFGDVRLFKVHVDDIIGSVKDFGPDKTNVEILALTPTRDHALVSQGALHEVPTELLLSQPAKLSGAASARGAETLSSAALEEQLKWTNFKDIQELAKAGYGIEAISLRTGTPLEQVVATISGNVPEAHKTLKYSSAADVEKALAVEKRTFALSTDMNKVPHAEMYARLNTQALDVGSQEIVEAYLKTSESELVRGIADKFTSFDIKIATGQMLKELEEFTGQQLKSSMFASANQVLSANPSLAALATHIGKDAIAIRNFVKEAFEEPLAKAMTSVIKNEASLIEANTALNLNASLSGYRRFKAGQFWQFDKDLPRADIAKLLSLGDDEFKAVLQASTQEGKEIATAAQFRGREFIIQTPEVRQLMEEFEKYGRSMYDLKNAHLKAIGKGSLQDVGFWTPSFNPANKEIAYVHDKALDKITLLHANTPEELNTAIAEYRQNLVKQYGPDDSKYVKIVTKDQQKDFNVLAGRHDPMYMEIADVTKRHGGSSASTFVTTDTSHFQDILEGYASYANRGIDDILAIQMHPVMNHLKNLSDVSQTGYSAETPNLLKKLVNKPTDPGMVLKNILMGYPNLSEHKAWSGVQKFGEAITDHLLGEITQIFKPILAPIVGKLSGTKVRTAAEWDNIVKEMANRGIVNPFEGLDKEFGVGRYLAEGQSGRQGLTMRTVALSNSMAATVMLRFMELGQPLVNALSLPILTSGAINRRMAASFMGNAIDPSAKFSIGEAMHDGIRLMNHPTMGPHYSKLAESRNLFSSELRNVTEILQYTRNLDASVTTAMEDLIESKFVRMMSKPSDISEEMVRRSSFFTGIGMAKKAYPGISDTGALIFARNFMDEAIGNYTAAQRPAMFQGTFGVAAGLFQTYMLTMAQQMYRQVEHRDWKSLGKMLLTQSTIFGTSSLPGFHPISEGIAKHFSDQNIDLETGTFRALPDEAANILLYGLPSSFGPGIVTRGDIQPRVPNPFQGLDSVATINIAKQAYGAMERVAGAAFTANENSGKAMLEALSLQSISRPIARMSELVSGVAITGSGDVVAKGSEIYNTQGILARIMATRPLAEIKARQAQHLNSLYGGFDSDKRKDVTRKLKSAIRNGNLDGEALDNLAYEYLRTGTPTGWRAAQSEAIAQAGRGGDATVLQKLKPGSPLAMMIEHLD